MVPSDLDFRRKPFTKLESLAAPIDLINLDTDIIIRIERLSQLPRGQLGPWAFEPLRYRKNGEENPDFILNQKPFREAKILITAANFGCGSSREMAVWAIQELGVRCLIGSSFGDIFRSNCFQNGLLVLQFSADEIQAMQAMADQVADKVLVLSVREAASNATSRWLSFRVVDHGPGISEDVAQQLFTPFFTTKAEGMGLGLSLCRTVVEQHGGRLSHWPNQPCGTVFSFTLSCRQATAVVEA